MPLPIRDQGVETHRAGRFDGLCVVWTMVTQRMLGKETKNRVRKSPEAPPGDLLYLIHVHKSGRRINIEWNRAIVSD